MLPVLTRSVIKDDVTIELDDDVIAAFEGWKHASIFSIKWYACANKLAGGCKFLNSLSTIIPGFQIFKASKNIVNLNLSNK